MNLEQFKQLSKKFENKNFEKDNLAIEKTLYFSSWFGNLLSVIFAFFFVNSLVSQAAIHFVGQSFILPFFILLFLVMFELLKRFVFANVTTTLLLMKTFTVKIFMGIVFALLLTVGSFYLSMSGARHYVNKTEIISNNLDSTLQISTLQIDSLNKIEVAKVEAKIQYVYEAAQQRKKTTLTREEVKDIKIWEQEVKDLKLERDLKVKNLKTELIATQEKQEEKSQSSQVAFLLLSGFIELVVLIGVGFRQYYSFVCFKQMKERIENDPNFKKLELYKQMLQVLFNNGKISINSELPSMNKFNELINAKSKTKTSAITVREFMGVINHLKIIYTSGKKKFTQVNYEKALEILNNYIPLNE